VTSILKHTTSKSEVIKSIQQLVPPGSPEPQSPTVLAALKTLTTELIQAYKAEGQLQGDPFADVWNRSIHLYKAEVISKLKGKTVLVTGGEGCVGSYLVKKLVELGAKQVISVDKARCFDYCEVKPIATHQESVTSYAADIRNYDALKYIFDVEKPDVVFHLAAQRLPWLAEIKIHETVTTSIFGTQNIIQLCEMYKVQQCIFSSTGKASRYFTTEVYAASKKFCEWQFAQAAYKGNVTYGMVRFTHMLNNSSVCEQIETKIKQGKIVNVHAPHRYLTAQNVDEALHLLLNALVVSQPGKIKFLTVRNLGWPTETLEVALHKIVQSGKELPIYFQGLIPGYEEPCFLGQFDWSSPTEINLLINALENPQLEASGDMMIAEIAPFSVEALDKNLLVLQTFTAVDLPEVKIKQALGKAVREVSSSIFAQASPEMLLKILKWGINPRQFNAEGLAIESYRDVVELLLQGLYGRVSKDALIEKRYPHEFEDLITILSTLSSIEQEVAYLKAVYHTVAIPGKS